MRVLFRIVGTLVLEVGCNTKSVHCEEYSTHTTTLGLFTLGKRVFWGWGRCHVLRPPTAVWHVAGTAMPRCETEQQYVYRSTNCMGPQNKPNTPI